MTNVPAGSPGMHPIDTRAILAYNSRIEDRLTVAWLPDGPGMNTHEVVP